MIDDRTYKILKRLYRHKELPVEKVERMAKHKDKNKLCPETSALLSNHFVSRIEKEPVSDGAGGVLKSESFLKITVQGRAYIEDTRRTRFQFLIPTVIAGISLLVSIFALLR